MNPRGTRRDWAHAALVLVSGAMALTTVVEASDPISILPNTQGITWPRSEAREIAEQIRGVNDLLFLGRFQSWQSDTTRWHVGSLVRCRIDSILMGYSRDSLVEFRRIVRPSFAASRLQSGTRILGRLSRACTTERANCGDFMVIDDDGTLLSDCISDEQSHDKERDPRPLRLQDIPTAVLREGDIDVLLAAAGGVACAYLMDNRLLPSAGGVWRCFETTWVVPTDDSLPAYVRFPRKESCFAEGPGARYLLPIPHGFRGDTLYVDCCPRVLQVVRDQSASLGVTLAELPEVVVRRDDGHLQLVEPKWLQKGRK